jgi:hypothetical protein
MRVTSPACILLASLQKEREETKTTKTTTTSRSVSSQPDCDAKGRLLVEMGSQRASQYRHRTDPSLRSCWSGFETSASPGSCGAVRRAVATTAGGTSKFVRATWEERR